ncbi:MAG: hypothetical protein ACOYI7_08180 [Candidatus Excrementavichristensenella sp.]|jgi:hypothetical protein
MKKSVHCILAIAVAISILALPISGFAEGYNMATIIADGFQLTIGDITFDVGASVQLSTGMDDSMQRGFLTGDLYGGNASILQLLLAVEDAQIKGYMRNEEGGISHFVQAPVQDVLALLGSAAGMGTDTASALPPLKSMLQGAQGSSGAAYLDLLADRIERIADDGFGARTIGRARIQLFGEAVEAETLEAALDLAQYLALIDEVAEADPWLQVLWKQVKMLYEAESGMDFSEIPVVLAAADVETSITLFVYKVDESSGRIMTDILVSTEGHQVPIRILMDYAAGGGYDAVDVGLTATSPDEGDVSIYLRANDSTDGNVTKRSAESGFLFTAYDGEAEGFEFSIESQSTKAGGIITGGSIADIIGKQASGQGAATDAAAIAMKANIPSEGLDFSLGIQYDGKHYDQEGDLVYYGTVVCDMEEGGGEVGTIAFNTEYRLSYMPEGELLSPGDMDVLNPFHADEEALSALEESAALVLQNTLALAEQYLGGGEPAGTGESPDAPTDPGFSGELRGTLAGYDGEAFTVQDADGAVYTFFFDETFPRSAFDPSLDYGSSVLVLYDGEFDEYGQFAGVFTVFDTSASVIEGGD